MKQRSSALHSRTALRRRAPSRVHAKRLAIKRRVRASQPLHIRFALHPMSIFLLLLCGVFMVGWTFHANADSYTVTATVPAAALTEGAIITTPADDTTTTSDSVTVEGTCPDSSYVTLTRNNIFSGVAPCDVSNTFSILTTLSPGDNTLVAQDYNVTDQPGPTTPGIVVHYHVPDQGGGSSGGSSGSGSDSGSGSPSGSSDNPTVLPLLLASSYRFQAVELGNNFRWVVALQGGTPPYAITIDWGDNGQTVQTSNRTGNIVITHDYAAAGYFTIIVTAADANGSSTSLQLVAFVKEAGAHAVLFQNGNSTATPSTGNPLLDTLTASKWLLVAWPSYGVATLMVASFWLGEQQQIQQLLTAHITHLRLRGGRLGKTH